MKRESRTVDRSDQVVSPATQRHLPLVDLLVDTRAELMELAVASGLKVLATMLEADRTAICGPRCQHDAEREAVRAGTVPSEVVLGALNREQLPRIDLRWHDLRHEGACRLLADGVDIRIIQLMLGHASILQTQRYLNVTDEELRRGLEVSWNNNGRPLRLASGA